MPNCSGNTASMTRRQKRRIDSKCRVDRICNTSDTIYCAIVRCYTIFMLTLEQTLLYLPAVAVIIAIPGPDMLLSHSA